MSDVTLADYARVWRSLAGPASENEPDRKRYAAQRRILAEASTWALPDLEAGVDAVERSVRALHARIRALAAAEEDTHGLSVPLSARELTVFTCELSLGRLLPVLWAGDDWPAVLAVKAVWEAPAEGVARPVFFRGAHPGTRSDPGARSDYDSLVCFVARPGVPEEYREMVGRVV